MELYLAEHKLTGKQGLEIGLVQAVTSSVSAAQKLAYTLAHQYTTSTNKAHSALQTDLWALSGELPPSERYIASMDAFAQAQSVQAKTGAVTTEVSVPGAVFGSGESLLERSKLRKTIQAALSARENEKCDDRLHVPKWEDVEYARKEMMSSTCSAQEHLTQLLPYAHHDTSLISDSYEIEVKRPLKVTVLAAKFTQSLTEQPEVPLLDVLMAAYGDIGGGVTEHPPRSPDALNYVPEPSVADDKLSCLLVLRPAKMASWRRSSLVIAHSLLGDHRGYGRLWNSALPNIDVYALRHRELSGADGFALSHSGACEMIGEYTECLLAGFVSCSFDLIGASFGAVLASHVWHASKWAGGWPRRLVLIDPPPAVPQALTIPKMVTSLRTAAMGVLLIHLQVEMGTSVWEQFPQLQDLPEEALAYFVTAQCMPESLTQEDLLAWANQFRRLLPVYRKCRHAFHVFSTSICAIGADGNGSNSPAILMALSSKRWSTFSEMFPGITDDDVHTYGRAATLRLPGQHIAMLDRCISNRDAAFTGALERFILDSFGDAWWWSEHVSPSRTAATLPQPTGLGALVPMFKKMSHWTADTPSQVTLGVSAGEVSTAVQHVAHELLESRTSADAPLMDAGLDSLGAVEFRARLKARLGDAFELSETLTFDFPTLRQIEAHLRPRVVRSTQAVSPVAANGDALTPSQVTLGVSAGEVSTAVQHVAHELLESRTSADAPLMDAGLDSLGAVEFRARLKARLGDAFELSETLTFDFPTLRQIEAHLRPRVVRSTQAVSPVAANGDALIMLLDILQSPTLTTAGTESSFTAQRETVEINLIAMCTLLPGAVATVDAYGCMSALGVDLTSEVPATRWDVDAVDASAVAYGLGEMVRLRMRYGAFARGAQLFDASGFAVSPVEASVMDPQQRLLLENGYTALYLARMSRGLLLGSDTGVYLGYSVSDFAQVLTTSPLGKSVYSATGCAGSIASGRLSYVLGLHGACAMIDTACSAGLVAASFARAALVLHDSKVASVMAVNLILSPNGAHIPFAIAGMTSATGKCHTFDKDTDGYARSEACGALVLQTTASKKKELVVLKGSAVRCDGKSASLTAPNGQAQRQVISAALSIAQVAPVALTLLEAHGTGTALGDPMEVGSVHAVVLKHRDTCAAPMAVGSTKANAGHAEPGAGFSGLVKLAIGLARGDAAPNAQLRALNPNLGSKLRGVTCTLPIQLGRLASDASTGGVSSFAYSGTIAHAALRRGEGDDMLADSVAPLVYRLRSFPWQVSDQKLPKASVIASYDIAWWTLSSSACQLASYPMVRVIHCAGPTNTVRAPPSRDTLDADLCIVGAGTIGLMVARDTASCGFSSVVLEQEAAIGGVWAKNDYPGLRLQISGASYRCLSVAPAWTKVGEGKDDVCYRPTGQEVLAYLQELASSHKLISVMTNTSYLRHTGSGGKYVVRTSQKQFAVRAIAFAPGAHETTAGSPHWPIDPSTVTNGACIVHSSALAACHRKFHKAQKKYVVGASKAAIDILETLDPEDEGVIWAHRGHIVFHNRDRIHAALRRGKAASSAIIAQAHTGNLYLKNQQFAIAFHGMLKSGAGIHVGLPLSAQPMMRGGVQSEASMAFVRRFIQCQVIVKTVRCHDGVLQICCEDGRVLSVTKDDAAVLCTGQRASNAGEGSYARRAEYNKDGLFHVAPFSSTTPTNALYMLHCVVSYLKGTPSAYNDGRVAAAFAKQAKYMETLKDRGPWSRFWANMGGVEHDIAPLIYDSAKYQALGLDFHHRWCGEWYGNNVNVEEMFSLLAAEPKAESEAVLAVNTGVLGGAVVMLLTGADRVGASGRGLLAMLSLAQVLASVTAQRRLMFITSGAQSPAPGVVGCSAAGVAHATAWGFGRALRNEHPSLNTCSMDGSTAAAAALMVKDEAEIAWTRGIPYSSRLRQRGANEHGSSNQIDGRVWLITGGLGGLGLRAATLLVSGGATRLMLSSRSGRVARNGQGLADCLSALGSMATVAACDGSDSAQAAQLQSACALAHGVLHSAGVTDDQRLLRMTASTIPAVLSPKMMAAAYLHASNAPVAHEALVLYSSGAATFGSVGQANYAAANAGLDSLALYRHSCGLAASSLQPSNVSGMGMAQAANDAGLHHKTWSLELEQYADCVRWLLAGECGVHLPLPRDLMQMAAHSDAYAWRQLTMQPLWRDLSPGLSPAARASETVDLVTSRTNASIAHVRRHGLNELILEELRELISSDNGVDVDMSLMEAGLDSNGSTELTSRLSILIGMEVSPTLVFEQPTARAIAVHLLEKWPQEQQMSTPVPATVGASVESEHCNSATLCGVAGRWPGSCASGNGLWHVMRAGGNAVGEVPAARWTLQAEVDILGLRTDQVAAVSYGGFLAAVNLFDNCAFGVSPAEAGAMDPQQRLLLHTGYTSLHASGHRRTALIGHTLGGIVGISKNDFQQLSLLGKLTAAASGIYVGTGSDNGMVPRRLAYTLGLLGPAFAVHTACSSSLVALDVAKHYHGLDEWSVSGVHLVLTPPLWAADSGGIHSLKGRSYVFDTRADGFARSEASVSVALLPRAPDLTVHTSATYQDGKSVSLTAPNGQAQRLMLRAVLGGVSASEGLLVEAAANGSPLGDPIEVGALVSTLPSSMRALFANGKGSIAHSEPCSGHSGLALLGAKLRHAHGSANAQLRLVNPVVNQSRQSSLHVLSLQHMPSLQHTMLRSVGHDGTVSAFSYSGTIACAVLRFCCNTQSDHSTPSPFLYKRCVFPWRLPVHPFVQWHVPSVDGATIFRTVVSSTLRSPVDDHIIGQRALFPATAYLEMARAANCAFTPSSVGVLRDVIFMQPFVVGASGLHADFRAVNGHFEVASGELSTALSPASSTTHCTGSLAHQDITEWQHVNYISIRGQLSDRCVDVISYYEAMHSNSAAFGPGYRRLTQVWCGTLTCLGQLCLRTRRQGTIVHPADLDAGVSMKPVLWSNSIGLPFLVANALVQDASHKLAWAVSASLIPINAHAPMLPLLCSRTQLERCFINHPTFLPRLRDDNVGVPQICLLARFR